MTVPAGLPPELPARIAAAHDAAFREVTGKWREYRGLVRTPQGGTFFPSEVAALAAALPRARPGRRLLEVGSGDGRVLTLLAFLRAAALVRFELALGVEIVPEYLEAARLARTRLAPGPDMTGITERCADVLDVDLGGFDTLLYFAGGAMPPPAERAFGTKLRRELRSGSRLVAWGPEAEALGLPRLRTVPAPGYHALHVYRGQGRGAAQPAG